MFIKETDNMKQIMTVVGAFLLLASSVQAIAQDEPGVVVTTEMQAVVTVKGVHHENRTVTVEGPGGDRIVIKVPEEAQNLYQIQPGQRFNIRYAQAVAVGLLDPNEEPNRGAGEVMKLAAKGATPGGVIVRVMQVSGRVEDIDYDARMIVVRNADGNLREFLVGDEVNRFEEVKVGDMVGLRVTEAFAMEMIPE
jgi:hypothetical protein